MSMIPYKAIYGCQDNRHDLLSYDGKGEPPNELIGWTDKPAGHVVPKDDWWKSVNCGPLSNNMWALWCTVPDETAARGGMVKSEVLLWSREDITKVEDITPYVTLLLNKEKLNGAPKEKLEKATEALINNRQLTVIDDIGLVPSLICNLWPRLWANARKGFSARLAFTPPQILNGDNFPTLYYVPSSLINQWHVPNINIVNLNEPVKNTRGVNYLIEEQYSDATLESVVKSSGELEGKLNILGKLSRLADSLESFRLKKDFDSAVACLRTAISCWTSKEFGRDIKLELIEGMKREITSSLTSSQVLSLSNISNDSISMEMPSEELALWVQSNLASEPSEIVQKFFTRLNDEFAQWWKEGVVKGIENILSQPRLSNGILGWLLFDSFKGVLDRVSFNIKELDEKLFNLRLDAHFSKSEFQLIESMSLRFGWPKLHAWAAFNLYEEGEVFAKQCASMEGWESGVPYLVDSLEPKIVIELLSNERFQPFTSTLAKRVAKESSILDLIDIQHDIDFSLWLNQLMYGGAFYPSSCEKESFVKQVCHSLDRIEHIEAFRQVAKNVSHYVLKQKDRVWIWSQLDATQSKLLAEELVSKLKSTDLDSFYISASENHYIRAFQGYLGSAEILEPRLLIFYLSQNISTNEQEIISLIGKVQPSQWNVYALTLGTLVKKNRWSKVATELFQLGCGYSAKVPELKLAMEQCYTLLGMKNLFLYFTNIGSISSADRPLLLRSLAEHCAEVAYDRLEYYWELAGGRKSKLVISGSLTDRWLSAITLADNGGLGGGVKVLVDALLREFPHNNELKEIRKLL